MLRLFRVLYTVSAWTFVVGLLLQVFLIGEYLFSDPSAIGAHRAFGWVLHLWPLVILLFAALSRAGRRHWLWALALAVVIFITPILPGLRESAPVIAAFHPVFAVTGLVLAVIVAWNSVAAWRLGDARAPIAGA
jgi:hypothetical protein